MKSREERDAEQIGEHAEGHDDESHWSIDFARRDLRREADGQQHGGWKREQQRHLGTAQDPDDEHEQRNRAHR